MKSVLVLMAASACLAQPPLTITTTAMARGTSRQQYLQKLTATGGIPPYRWTMTGALLDGLVLEPESGLVSGVPVFARAGTVSVVVQDQRGIRMARNVPLRIDPPIATVGMRYAAAFRNSGEPPYTCEVILGSPPPGLPMLPDCRIDGTPTRAGPFNFFYRIISSNRVEAIFDPIITVVTRAEQLLLSQSGLTFPAVVDGAPAAPVPQSFRVLNIGTGTVQWSATATTLSGGGWLVVSPASGSSTGGASGNAPAVTVTTNTAGLAPGDYYGQVSIAAAGVGNSPQIVTVVLTVAPGGVRVEPTVSPLGFSFAGPVNGPLAPEPVTITNSGTAPVTFTATAVPDGPSWFVPEPATGTVPAGQSARVLVRATLLGQSPGVRTGRLRIQFSDGSVATVVLQMVVTAAAAPAVGRAAAGSSADCEATRLLPVFTRIGARLAALLAWPVPLEVRVVDDCGAPHLNGSVLVTLSTNDPPVVMVSQRDGNWSGTWTPRNLEGANVILRARAQSISVPLRGGGFISGIAEISRPLQANPNPPPLIASGGVVSAATFQPATALAPGNLVAIFGSQLASTTEQAAVLPLPATLGGAQVFISGRPAALLFASPGQINAMLPFELSTSVPLQMAVRRGDALSVPETFILAASQPGVFTQAQSGAGQAVVVGVRADGAQFINGPEAPLREGDVMVIYAAGLGGIDNAVAAGAPSPTDPLVRTAHPAVVTVGGVNCEVLFSGLTPGFVGLYQVNATVAAGVPKGPAVPMALTIGGQTSPPVSLNIQ